MNVDILVIIMLPGEEIDFVSGLVLGLYFDEQVCIMMSQLPYQRKSEWEREALFIVYIILQITSK